MRLIDRTVDVLSGRVELDTGTFQLTDLERRLFAYLARHPGRDVPREELLTHVWEYRPGVVTRAINATVHRLRAKIEPNPADPKLLLTVWGTGFRFEPPPSPVTHEPNDHFIGRAKLRDRLQRELGQHSLLTLVGPGGIGKTRLARRVVETSGRPWIWVDLSAARTSEDLNLLVSTTLGTRRSSSGGLDLQGTLRQFAGHVIVFDNLDEVQDEVAGLLEGWSADPAAGTVLGTSRQPLHLGQECVVTVGPLDVAASQRLFLDRMPSVGDTTPQALEGLMPLLDGVPLAIELAARLTDVLSIDQLCHRLRHGLDVLVEDRRHRPERHATLEAALQGSIESLPDDALEALSRLAVVEGGFFLDDAEALLGTDALGRLRRLVQASLVHRFEPGYRLLNPIRDFVRRHHPPRDSDVTARWHAWLAKRAEPIAWADAFSTNEVQWVRDHRVDLEVSWAALMPTDRDAAVAIGLALEVHYKGTGPASRRVEILTALRALDLSPRQRGRVSVHLATAHFTLGDFVTVARYVDEAEAIARQTADATLEARCGLARMHLARVHDVAVDPKVEARARAVCQGPAAEWMSRLMGAIATRLLREGDLDGADQKLQEAIDHAQRRGDTRSTARHLADLGFVAARRGEFARSQQLLDASLATLRELDDPVLVALVLWYRAQGHWFADEFDRALAVLPDATQLHETCGVSDGDRAVMALLGVSCHALQGEFEAAAAALVKVGATRRPGDRARKDWLWAWVEAELGNVGPARRLIANPPAAKDARTELLRALVSLAAGSANADAEARRIVQWAERLPKHEATGGPYLRRVKERLTP